MKIVQTLLLLLCVEQASAWWGTGHLLVAKIAQDLLETQNPGAFKAALDQLSLYTQNKDEGDHPFVECATYADDIKGKGGHFQSGWHFIDTPYLDEGGKITDFDFKFDQHNITEVMNNIEMWITKAPGYQSTWEYKQIMSNLPNIREENQESLGFDENVGVSFALRLLIHYAGDIHQPLHATSRVDHEYKHGDRGGNSFRLPMKLSAGNLHAVWDSVFYEFTGYPKLPMNQDLWDQFGNYSSTLLKKFPESSLDNAKDLKYVDWANESFEISKTFVYDEINHHENQALPEDYITKGKEITQKQIVLAGYRVNYLIQHLYGSTQEEEETFLN